MPRMAQRPQSNHTCCGMLPFTSMGPPEGQNANSCEFRRSERPPSGPTLRDWNDSDYVHVLTWIGASALRWVVIVVVLALSAYLVNVLLMQATGVNDSPLSKTLKAMLIEVSYVFGCVYFLTYRERRIDDWFVSRMLIAAQDWFTRMCGRNRTVSSLINFLFVFILVGVLFVVVFGLVFWLPPFAGENNGLRLLLSAIAIHMMIQGLALLQLQLRTIVHARPHPVGVRPAESGSGSLRVLHLSDLHITRGAKYLLVGEKEVNERIRKQPDSHPNERFREICEHFKRSGGFDVLLLSGDVTDTGNRQEWQHFLTLSKELLDNRDFALVLVPGNHDININSSTPLVSRPPETEVVPVLLRWLDLHDGVARAVRILNFVALMKHLYYDDQRVFTLESGCKLTPLIESRAFGTLLECADALDLEFFNGLDDERRHRLKRARSAQALLGRFHSLHPVSRRLANLVQQVSTAWTDMFPYVVEMREHGFAFVVLNSVGRSTYIATNACGEVDPEQIERLSRLTTLLSGRGVRAVYAMHHHLALVDEGRATSKKPRDGFIALRNADELTAALASVSTDIVVFHGHRHVPLYGEATIAGPTHSTGVRVISADSSTLRPGDGNKDLSGVMTWTLACDEMEITVSATERWPG